MEQPAVLDTQQDIAKHFGVSMHAVAVWSSKGMPGERGRWVVDECGEWLRDRGYGPYRPQQQDLFQNEAERLKAAQADLAEQKRDLQAGELIVVADLNERMGNLWDMLRDLGEAFGKTLTISGQEAQQRLNDVIGSEAWRS